MTNTTALVLIHGAHRSRVGLMPVARWFGGQGFDARCFGYRTRRDSLVQHARRLSQWLDAWMGPSRAGTARGTSDEAERLCFLTHSMGGLVARQYLAMFGQRHASEHRLVMLGPPNRGATLAAKMAQRPEFRLAYGAAANELQPARVAKLGPLPDHARGLVIAGGSPAQGRGFNPSIDGDDDGVVALADTYLEGTQHLRVVGVHAALQWKPKVLRRAADFLREST